MIILFAGLWHAAAFRFVAHIGPNLNQQHGGAVAFEVGDDFFAGEDAGGSARGNKKRRGPYEVPTPPRYRTDGGVGWLPARGSPKPALDPAKTKAPAGRRFISDGENDFA